MKITSLLSALLFMWASLGYAQSDNNSNGDFSGTVFGDYYWVASNHNPDLEGRNGFWIRRVYFTYDREISDTFSARFRLESSTAGDFTSEAKMAPVVKDLYLRWERGEHQVEAGISSTPTWGLVEDVWGYRSVEKSPLDLNDYGSSRDFGLSFEGTLDSEQRISYHFMLGNGSSNRAEINKGKKFMLSLGYELTENVVVEVYGDYNDQEADQNSYTLQGFAGYQSEDLNFGILYAHQTREGLPVVGKQNLDLLSLFGRFGLAENTGGFIRIDHSFDSVAGVAGNSYYPISGIAPYTVLIAGADFDLGHDIHLLPNFEATLYEESQLGVTPTNDLIPRLTLSYEF